MGHAAMAATAVRYLRSVGAPTSAEAAAPAHTTPVAPRPALRAVREGERAPLDPAAFRAVLGHFASGVTVITAPAPARVSASAPARVSAPAPRTSDPTADTPADGPADTPTDGPTTPPTAPPADAPAGFACQSFASLSLDPPLVTFMVARTSTTWPRIARAGVFCVNILGAHQEGLCRAFAVSGADKFAGVFYTPAPVTGSPRLAGAPAWVDCTVQAVHTGGDHLIVVGRVAALGTDPDAARSGPLLFHRGAFARFSA
ncbi:flavin reductase family protein [Streptomyces sp. NPDC052496]|uniref:flavin reductase family protein n=1 Tax=Streptomyces sp. NPDC052496 TaxID=3154951 RepID=UPI00342A60FB